MGFPLQSYIHVYPLTPAYMSLNPGPKFVTCSANPRHDLVTPVHPHLHPDEPKLN